VTPQLASILADLEIEVVDIRVRREPGQTCATVTMERILAEHGPGHLTLVLRSIVETTNNRRELVAPVILAISDLILSHPEWPQTTQWLDALDGIDIAEIRQIAKANRVAAPIRPAISTMIYLHLREIFAPQAQKRLI
jgi:hypothetical protein